MFLVTQLIGLAVIYSYTPVVQQQVINGTLQNVTTNPLPYGMQPPQTTESMSLLSIVIAFIVAIGLVFILAKFRAAVIMRLWFFLVVTIVMSITFNALLYHFFDPMSILPQIIAVIIALPLAVIKIFKRNILVHNITELLIYPGVAVVFVPILGLWSIIVLLIAISLYDMWAVWHTGFMQKMAKYQIEEMKVFAGFYIPYLNKKQRQLIKQAKLSNSKNLEKKKLKVNLAILGGGDVVFPIITSGVIMSIWGFLPALAVTICATLSLLGLFIMAKKGKFYPAMPFLTAGLFIGIAIAYLIHILL